MTPSPTFVGPLLSIVRVFSTCHSLCKNFPAIFGKLIVYVIHWSSEENNHKMINWQNQRRPVKGFTCLFKTGETFINVIDCLEAILDFLCAQLLSHAWLFAVSWTVACQAPLSLEFSRQEYWSGLAFSSRPRHWSCISCNPCIGRQILYHCATWEAVCINIPYLYLFICWWTFRLLPYLGHYK